MATAEVQSKPSPPYPSFKTLKAFLEDLKATDVPQQIDRSIMGKMSGITQSQILAAFRFLGLVDKDDKTTNAMKRLVTAVGTPQWPATLNNIVMPAYMGLLRDIDISTATAKQLRDCFKDGTGIDGETLSKACRFYLKLLDDAQIKHSPHLKSSQRKPVGKRSNGPRRAESRSNTGAQSRNDGDRGANPRGATIPEGMMEIPIYLPEGQGRLIVPKQITEADCDMVDAILRAYARRQIAAKAK